MVEGRDKGGSAVSFIKKGTDLMHEGYDRRSTKSRRMKTDLKRLHNLPPKKWPNLDLTHADHGAQALDHSTVGLWNQGPHLSCPQKS